ncbi:MAG: hypothetical protein J5793_03545 [Clostridia bacterium]|nr:hypothetical protein [Clostridia bacterium]
MAERLIKKDIADPSGSILVKVNLRSPEIRCASAKDPLKRHAVPFYVSLSDTLASYAEGDLFKAASKRSGTEGFIPFAAVMNWEMTCNSDNYISFVTDISISDGRSGDRERRTQIWDRKTGQRCVFYDFFLPGSAGKMASKVMPGNEKRFDRELFVLRENGYEFFKRNGKGTFEGVFFTKEELADEGLLRDMNL